MPTHTFALSGDVNGATARATRESLRTFVGAHYDDVVLDCRSLLSIDNEGLRTLTSLQRRLRREGRHLAFVNLNDLLTRACILRPRRPLIQASNGHRLRGLDPRFASGAFSGEGRELRVSQG